LIDKIELNKKSDGMSDQPAASEEVEPIFPLTVIEARTGRQMVDWRELWQYRDLFFFLVWRDIKTRYAQSVLGVGWALIQPVFSMIIFTIIFGNFVQVSSDGVPYAIFNYAALVPWTFFAGSLTGATGSLVGSANMITKVYFPRLIIPLAPVLGKLVDFAIAMLLLLVMMLYFGIRPTMGVLFLPVLVLMMMLAAAGLGMWLTALAVQYRDINYGLGFFVQILMYAAPVVYSTNVVPEELRLFYALNPMVGVIEGFRSALLATNPMPWDLIGVGAAMGLFLFISGALYFRHMERIFADVV
jgi:lipopolysaccharide transport system permease protein